VASEKKYVNELNEMLKSSVVYGVFIDSGSGDRYINVSPNCSFHYPRLWI